MFDPDGVQKDPCGGGHTYEEAAAAAWIGLNRRSGGLDEPVSERDYAEEFPPSAGRLAVRALQGR